MDEWGFALFGFKLNLRWISDMAQLLWGQWVTLWAPYVSIYNRWKNYTLTHWDLQDISWLIRGSISFFVFLTGRLEATLVTQVCGYCEIFNISCTLGNEIVDYSDVVGALPVGAAPTTSSFSTEHLAAIDCAITAARRDKKHLSFGIWCDLY